MPAVKKKSTKKKVGKQVKERVRDYVVEVQDLSPRKTESIRVRCKSDPHYVSPSKRSSDNNKTDSPRKRVISPNSKEFFFRFFRNSEKGGEGAQEKPTTSCKMALFRVHTEQPSNAAANNTPPAKKQLLETEQQTIGPFTITADDLCNTTHRKSKGVATQHQVMGESALKALDEFVDALSSEDRAALPKELPEKCDWNHLLAYVLIAGIANPQVKDNLVSASKATNQTMKHYERNISSLLKKNLVKSITLQGFADVFTESRVAQQIRLTVEFTLHDDSVLETSFCFNGLDLVTEVTQVANFTFKLIECFAEEAKNTVALLKEKQDVLDMDINSPQVLNQDSESSDQDTQSPASSSGSSRKKLRF